MPKSLQLAVVDLACTSHLPDSKAQTLASSLHSPYFFTLPVTLSHRHPQVAPSCFPMTLIFEGSFVFLCPSTIMTTLSPPCSPVEPLHWGLDVVPQPEMRQRVPGVTQHDERVRGRTARVMKAGATIFTSMMSLRWSLLGMLSLKSGWGKDSVAMRVCS